MKLLKIKLGDTNLFNESEFNLYCNKRILEKDIGNTLYQLHDKIFTYNTIVITGKNASGKTSWIKLIAFILELFTGSLHIDLILKYNFFDLSKIMKNNKLKLITYWYQKNNIYELYSELVFKDNKYKFIEEIVKIKPINNSISKSELLLFDESKNKKITVKKRSELSDETKVYLKSDESIFSRYIELFREIHTTTLSTDFNYHDKFDENLKFHRVLLDLFDKNITYLNSNKDDMGTNSLKLINFDEVIISRRINEYISSGTIRGYQIFLLISKCLKDGGYLIIDEIENHLNRSIVDLIIKLFENNYVNKNGATIIFTTHYPELLDFISRNDEIYITYNENHKIVLKNLVDFDIRNKNDIKRSVLYKSGLLESAIKMEDVNKLIEVFVNE